MEHPLVQVTWHDAHSISGDGWVCLAEMEKGPCVVETVGWLIEEANPKHIVIAQSYNDSELYDNIIAIPVAMVVKTRILS
jgi:hypothetical protein